MTTKQFHVVSNGVYISQITLPSHFVAAYYNVDIHRSKPRLTETAASDDSRKPVARMNPVFQAGNNGLSDVSVI